MTTYACMYYLELFSSLFSVLTMDFKTNNTAEGFHRDYNSLQEKDKNYRSIYKSILVIKNIHREKKSQVTGSIAGDFRDPMAKPFFNRAKNQQNILSKYKNYNTPSTKLMCLHEIASSFNNFLCFADCEEDYEDDEDSDEEDDNEEESQN